MFYSKSICETLVYGEDNHELESQNKYWQMTVNWQATRSGIYPITINVYLTVFKNKLLIPVYRIESYKTRFVWQSCGKDRYK